MASSSSTTSGDFKYFSTKLFSRISQQNNGENIFLSPVSIALAMSMCTVGARHETLQQMLHVLEAFSIEQLTQIAEDIMRVFSFADQDKKVQLKLANRLYAQKTYKLQREYLNLVRNCFHADIKLEDFENKSEKVVQTINAWIEEQTNKRIRNLLSPGDCTPDTRLLLINCIYFQGTWVNPFPIDSTDKLADFHETDGTVTKIKLMHQYGSFNYIKNKNLGVQIVHMPYMSSTPNVQFVFTVILPKRSVRLEEVERKLTANSQLMEQILNHQGTTSETLSLYLPKFKMETTYQLNNLLIQLGMKDAFYEQTADFTGIVKKEDTRKSLYINTVIHKAFIDVIEEGTEAAASTATNDIVTACIGRHKVPKIIELKVDRPFLFTIREQCRGLTLFQGKFLSAKN